MDGSKNVQSGTILLQTRRHIPGDPDHLQRRCENFKYRIAFEGSLAGFFLQKYNALKQTGP